ncbi:MAG: TRAP transporter permease [Treponemataceae bacterium]|nr:MAG: TRAP transporter permease [Treponemataceae bacterium]
MASEIKATDIKSNVQLTEEQQKLIESLDKEQAVRKMGSPLMKKILYVLCVGVSLYHFVFSFMPTPALLKHRSAHVGMMLLLGFILYPFSKKAGKKFQWLDILLIIVSVAIPIYVWAQYIGIVGRAGQPNIPDLVMATALVIVVLEATRRMSGNALPILSLIFLAYGIFGKYAPGLFWHRGYTWAKISNQLFANNEGIYGSSVGIAASYIYLFILFGAVMSKCGMGAFFNDLALAAAGDKLGGPAKVSVVAAGLLGSINGSAVANVVTTGAFTIPLMEKTGYSKEFAGGVCASASVGGQLLPPVMGAAAFIMADNLGVKYSVIVIHAIVPALLYYMGIFLQVHLRASKNNLVGVPRKDLPKMKDVMRDKGHLLIPIILLLYLLLAPQGLPFAGKTLSFSAVIVIIATIVVSMFKKTTRMSPKDILDAFAEGAKGTVSVAMSCACVGIIVGVMSKTGFGLTMANTIIMLGGKSLMLTLLFSMITCMILGMGVPSIPAYIITAAVAAPALGKLGIPAISAHFFSFYFAMFANLTPPVALAAFAAAGISGGSAMKTGWASVLLAVAGFVVPFMFVYSPQIMLVDFQQNILRGSIVIASAVVAVILIAVGAEGYLVRKAPIPIRVIALVGALALIDKGSVISQYTDLIGAVILVAVLLSQFVGGKKQAVAAG